ncbi:MAG: cytochrome c oxidase subunit 3 [Bacteroidota bacterium]
MKIDQKRNGMHPQMFALILFMVTVVMIFSGLLSAYIVDRSVVREPMIFDLPQSLWLNLGVILLSSIPVQWAVFAIRRQKHDQAILGLGLTLAMGLLFLFGLMQSWDEMVESGLFLVNPESYQKVGNSASFFYVITGLHGTHLIGALIAVLVMLVRTVINRNKENLSTTPYWMTAVFWHFLGLLLVTLVGFMYYYQLSTL